MRSLREEGEKQESSGSAVRERKREGRRDGRMDWTLEGHVGATKTRQTTRNQAPSAENGNGGLAVELLRFSTRIRREIRSGKCFGSKKPNRRGTKRERPALNERGRARKFC